MTPPAKPQAKHGGWKKNVAAVCAALLIGLIGFVAYTFNAIQSSLAERYAAMDAGLLIQSYLDHHPGQWPRSWDELSDHAEPVPHWPCERIGTIKHHVLIQWGVDFEVLKAAESTSDPPYPVVATQSGVMAGPTLEHEANSRIFWTLQNTLPANAAPESLRQ